MAPTPFARTYTARWADMDQNQHMRHTAYIDYATQVRFDYLAGRGFGAAEFARERFGPIIFKETMEYFKEVRLNDAITIDFQVAGMSRDGRKWRLRHNIHNGDGALAGRLTTDGAWMDWSTRKTRAPPAVLFGILGDLPRSDDYAEP